MYRTEALKPRERKNAAEMTSSFECKKPSDVVGFFYHNDYPMGESLNDRKNNIMKRQAAC